MRFNFIVIALILVSSSTIFGQSAAKKTIRWASPGLPQDCCANYMVDGTLVTTYRDENTFFTVSLHTNVDDKYIMALIDFRNLSDTPITIYPDNFQLRLTEPINKIYNSLNSTDVAHEMEKRGRGSRFFRGIFAGMATRSAQVETTSSGRVAVNDNSGNSASGTYSGSSQSTVTVPDYEARERAQARNARERERNQQKADHFDNIALKANTLFKNQATVGVVFFKKEKFSPGAVLSITIGDTTYEIPYGAERSK